MCFSEPLGLVNTQAAVLVPPPIEGLFGDSDLPADLGHRAAVDIPTSALCSLVLICSGVCFFLGIWPPVCFILKSTPKPARIR